MQETFYYILIGTFAIITTPIWFIPFTLYCYGYIIHEMVIR